MTKTSMHTAYWAGVLEFCLFFFFFFFFWHVSLLDARREEQRRASIGPGVFAFVGGFPRKGGWSGHVRFLLVLDRTGLQYNWRGAGVYIRSPINENQEPGRESVGGVIDGYERAKETSPMI